MADSPYDGMSDAELQAELTRIKTRMLGISIGAEERAVGYIAQTAIMMMAASVMISIGQLLLFVLCACFAVVAAFLGAEEQRFAQGIETYVHAELSDA